MKNKIKAIILAGLMLLSAAGAGFTVQQAYSHGSSVTEMQPQGQPPEQQNGGDMQMPQEGANAGEVSGKPSKPENEPQHENNGGENMPQNSAGGRAELSAVYKAAAGACWLVFSLCLIYLIMGAKNRNFLKNKDKAVIYALSSVLLALALTFSTIYVSEHYILNRAKLPAEQVQERDTAELDKSNTAASNKIDLSSQSTDVTITKGGTYELSGAFSHSVIVDTGSEETELILNNAEITNESTAAIIGLSAGAITVNLKENTDNILTDGGISEYDGCIFSYAQLFFTGSGRLTVNGRQNEGEGIATEAADITINSGTYVIHSADDGINAGGDGGTITINGGDIYVDASGDGIDSNKNAVINGGTLFVMGSDQGGDAGIDTDAGYVINGGTVVALGSDMLEQPKDGGTQKALAVTLDEKMEKDTLVTLMQGDNPVLSFKAPKSFKTVVLSSAAVSSGAYKLCTEPDDGKADYGICADGVYAQGSYASAGGSALLRQ